MTALEYLESLIYKQTSIEPKITLPELLLLQIKMEQEMENKTV